MVCGAMVELGNLFGFRVDCLCSDLSVNENSFSCVWVNKLLKCDLHENPIQNGWWLFEATLVSITLVSFNNWNRMYDLRVSCSVVELKVSPWFILRSVFLLWRLILEVRRKGEFWSIVFPWIFVFFKWNFNSDSEKRSLWNVYFTN